MGKSQGTPLLAAGEWIGEPSIWHRQTAVVFFLGISPGRIGGGQACEIKLKSFPTEAPGRFTKSPFKSTNNIFPTH